VRLGEIETALEALEDRPTIYDSTEIARAGAFVSLDQNGSLRIERGFVRKEDEAPHQTMQHEEGDDSEEPPSLVLSASPDVLWPPNNKMRPVSVAVSTAAGAGVSGCFISAVHSSEGSLFPGEIDWQINGPLTVNLKAARTGSGRGRLYTVTVTCTTRSLSLVTGSATVRVPHDRSNARSK